MSLIKMILRNSNQFIASKGKNKEWKRKKGKGNKIFMPKDSF